MKEHPQCKFQVKVISGNDRPQYIFRKSHVTNLKALFTNFIYERVSAMYVSDYVNSGNLQILCSN